MSSALHAPARFWRHLHKGVRHSLFGLVLIARFGAGSVMGPNRRAQERERAAERKAAADARKIMSRAGRSASRNAYTRRILIRDAMIAIAIAFALVGAWELVAWLASIAMSNPDARVATGLVER
jgi:hypothetical protein